ncbi:MAG: hypothetical protein M0Q13_04205, partial [Methanothrix sp.]|nr:hypothetical protein [Methanothrix sp.]
MRASTSFNQRGAIVARPPSQKARKRLHPIWHKQVTCRLAGGKPPSGWYARRAEKPCLALLCGRTPEDGDGQTMKFSDKSRCSNVFLSWRYANNIQLLLYHCS